MMKVSGLKTAVKEYNKSEGAKAIYLDEYENHVYVAEPNSPWTHPAQLNHHIELVVKGYGTGDKTTEAEVQKILEDL
jgi:hypothetical protein